MLRTLRPFFVTFFCISTGLIAAAVITFRQHPDSHWILSAALPAFLCETLFYLASTFKQTRELFGKLRVARLQAMLLWVSAITPYLIFSLLSGTFHRNAFYLLAALTAALAFWFVVLPRRPAYDLGFLVVAAAPQIVRVFSRIYISPVARPPLQMDVLGHLAWIHAGVAALLVLRPWDPGEFGFWPTLREWQMGATAFLVGIVPIAIAAELLHDAIFESPRGVWWQVAGKGLGNFFGIFWVVALSEELFFRGFIQRALERTWKSPLPAIVIAALLFGSVHLWVHSFPNWRHALVAAMLGIACGVAYQRSGSVRASMVTHACVVVTWRLFF